MRPIVTRVAHAGHGDHRYFGHAALSELLGTEAFAGVAGLAIMGRRLTPDECELLDAIATSLSAADPRIWPLKACRMVASYGETLAGFAAGQLAMMGMGISPRIIGEAAEHLARLRVRADERLGPEIPAQAVAEHVAPHRRLAGYGIPFRDRDERFQALRAFMERRGYSKRPHWRAQEALSAWLLRERKLAPNIGIGLAAALLDIGCTPAQAGALSTFLIEPTFAANAFEAAQQREPLMQKLPDECVNYIGRPPRVSPRAQAALNKP